MESKNPMSHRSGDNDSCYSVSKSSVWALFSPNLAGGETGWCRAWDSDSDCLSWVPAFITGHKAWFTKILHQLRTPFWSIRKWAMQGAWREKPFSALGAVQRAENPAALGVFIMTVDLRGGGVGGGEPALWCARGVQKIILWSQFSLSIFAHFPEGGQAWAAGELFYQSPLPATLSAPSLKLLQLFAATTPSYPRNSYTILGI